MKDTAHPFYMAMIFGLGMTLASSAMEISKSPFVSLHEVGVTRVQALVAIARLTKTPLGIVVGKNSGLCEDTIQLDLDQASVRDALKKVISRSSNHLEDHGAAIDVVPDTVSDEEVHLLGQRLGAFSPRPAPMHVLGVIFDGWLEMAMHPGSGWSGEIPSSTSAVAIQLSTGPDATAKDVLNALISKGNGGLWLLQPQVEVQRTGRNPVANPLVEVFSYTDNDATLMSLACGR